MGSIALATDLRPDMSLAIRAAAALARASDRELVVVHAAMTEVPDVNMELGPLPGVQLRTRVHTCCDDIVDTLLDALNKETPDVVVVGTHQKGPLLRLAQGSVSEALVRGLDVPVLLVPVTGPDPTPGDVLRVRRMLIPVGEDPHLAASAVLAAAQLAEDLKAEQVDFRLLHVGTDLPHSIEVPARDGWTWTAAFADGPVINTLLDAEQDADMVVMATRGRDSLADWFAGTHTEQVVRRSRCPVLCVPC
jgi:nucleotide-binding universal stress UspA family protein